MLKFNTDAESIAKENRFEKIVNYIHSKKVEKLSVCDINLLYD
jgi:hypothetical protein